MQLTESIDIPRSPEQVFDVATDFENTGWMPMVKSLTYAGGAAPGGVGAIYSAQIKFDAMGVDDVGQIEIREMAKPNRVFFKILGIPVNVVGGMTITATPSGARVDLIVDAPKIPGFMFRGDKRRQAEDAIRVGLNSLRQQVIDRNGPDVTGPGEGLS